MDHFDGLFEGASAPSSMIADPKFGMVELEDAAKEVMVYFRGRVDWKVGLYLHDFEPEGFCLLLAHGWLKPHYPNKVYRVSEDFIKRVTSSYHIHSTAIKFAKRTMACSVCGAEATRMIHTRAKDDNTDTVANFWLCDVHFEEAVTPVDHEVGCKRAEERGL